MTNDEKATMIADQCRPCSDDFYSGVKQGVLLALQAESESIRKAKKWDELDEKIGKFYPEDEDDEDWSGDLIDIGEVAAMAFGYL